MTLRRRQAVRGLREHRIVISGGRCGGHLPAVACQATDDDDNDDDDDITHGENVFIKYKILTQKLTISPLMTKCLLSKSVSTFDSYNDEKFNPIYSPSICRELNEEC